MRTILVTGANGYIGKHVVDFLIKCKNVKVISCDISSTNCVRGRYVGKNILSCAEEDSLYAELGSPDILIHLAWQDGFNHQSDAHLKNLFSHFAFLRNMIDHGIKSISVMGTMHEVGYWKGEINAETPCNPLSPYGIAKNALRQSLFAYVEGKNTLVKWLRAYYIMGDDSRNKSIFSKIVQMASEGKKSFPFTTGLNKYDFIDIDELAKQISLASIQMEINGIINVCSGMPISLKDKVEEFIEKKHLDIRPEYGVFPTRKYDSPTVWGNADLIKNIIELNRI